MATDYLADADPAILQAFSLILRTLEGENASVQEASLGDLVAEMHSILTDAPIVPFEAAQIHAERVATRSGDFDPQVLARIRSGQRVAEPQYLLSVRRRDRLIATMDQRLREWDCLILPTTLRTAPLMTEVTNSQAFRAMNALMLRNPSFANFFDLCAISIPMPIEPMPAGVMLVGRHGTDEALLSIARAVEADLWESACAKSVSCRPENGQTREFKLALVVERSAFRGSGRSSDALRNLPLPPATPARRRQAAAPLLRCATVATR